MDPDEVVNRDPEEWKSIISKASPLVIHVMESLAKSRDINDPKVKNEIAAQMIPLIEDVPNTIERDTYRQRLARLLRVDEDALMGQSKIKPVRRQYTRTTSKQITDNVHHENARNIIEPSSEMEKHCLALLTRIPELIYRMDRLLQQSELDCLSEKDFSNTEYMEIFLIISKSLTQDELDPSEYILENIPPPQKDALKKLLDSYNPDKINEDDLISDLLRTVIRMRHNKINESLRQLRFLQEEEQEQGQYQGNIPFQDLVLTYTQNLLKLNHALVINQQIKQQ
jgi:DNA primase